MARFKVGDKKSLEVSVDAALIEAFAAYSGDNNPLHVDSDFAETTRFKRRVAHGMSYGALFSRLIGMDLPGPGALWMSQSFRFNQPVYLGDTLTLQVEVTAASESTNTLSLDCTATNQNGQQVMNGTGEVMVVDHPTAEQEDRPTKKGVAIVTGGTRGIGAAISKELAANGHAVVATYFQSGDEALNFANKNDGISVRKSDAGNPDEARELVTWVQGNIGPVEILVLNASGRDMDGDACTAPMADFERQMATQLHGPMAMVHESFAGMKERKKGAIVAIGSSYALNAPPAKMAPYVVAKSALTAWVKCLAVDGGPFGIRANVVAPGPAETSLLSGMDDRARKVLAARTPLRRLARPEDVARTVKFLASDDAAYITGTVLPVTGGALMP